MRVLAQTLLSCGGIGFLPKGSWVTIAVTSFLWPGVFLIFPAPIALRTTIFLALALVLFLIGAATIPWFCSDGKHDHEWITLDEVLGTLIATAPFLLHKNALPILVQAAIVAVVFGFFDGLKPLGIQRIDDAEHTPITVMLDDAVAGVYAAGVILVGQWIMGIM